MTKTWAGEHLMTNIKRTRDNQQPWQTFAKVTCVGCRTEKFVLKQESITKGAT
jgi:ribosomal protein S27E